jgi:hypothetical protein
MLNSHIYYRKLLKSQDKFQLNYFFLTRNAARNYLQEQLVFKLHADNRDSIEQDDQIYGFIMLTAVGELADY